MDLSVMGYEWYDVNTMGGDELRSLTPPQLAHLLTGALEAQDEAAAERATYYLDTARYGETAAVAMSQARDAAMDGNFSTAQHLEAIELVIAGAATMERVSKLTVWELAQYARRTSRILTMDTCDLITLISAAEASHGIAPGAGGWRY